MSAPLTIAVLPGDHIGREIVDAALHVLRAADEKYELGLDFQEHEVGHRSLRENGVTITDTVVAAARAADGIILGPCDNGGFPPVEDGGLNVPDARPGSTCWWCAKTPKVSIRTATCIKATASSARSKAYRSRCAARKIVFSRR